MRLPQSPRFSRHIEPNRHGVIIQIPSDISDDKLRCIMRTNNIQRSLLSMPGLKFVFTFVLLIALANTAMAYTLVFRDGHKVEVPSDFTVTTSTLTYEAAPGINRTVQVLLID